MLVVEGCQGSVIASSVVVCTIFVTSVSPWWV